MSHLPLGAINAEGVPRDAAGLGLWFARSPREDVDAAWLALVIWAAFDDEGRCVCSRRDLALCLESVRAKYRGVTAAIERCARHGGHAPPGGPAGPRTTPAEREGFRRMGEHRTRRGLERQAERLLALPAGSRVRLKAMVADPDMRRRLRVLIESGAHPRLRIEYEPLGRGHPRVMVMVGEEG